MATNSSILAWRIPWTEEPGVLQPMGSQRVRHDWANSTFTFTLHICWLWKSAQSLVISPILVLFYLYQWTGFFCVFPYFFVISCCCSSVAQSCPTLWPAACQASLSFTISQSLIKLKSIKSVMPYNHLIFCHPLLLLPSIFPSIRVFSNESALPIRWSKYWSFSFRISLSSEYSGLISFKIDWFDFLADQGTLKRFLQHHYSKASILWCSAFFMAQLSHPYITTGKTIALTRWTFVGKVMSLLFNMLSRLAIVFLPRSKHLLISWLQSPFTVGSLVPCRIPWGGTRTLSKPTLLFLNCSSLFFLHTFPSLTRNCLNLPLGRSWKLNEIYFL